jgi:hypothetical protein
MTCAARVSRRFIRPQHPGFFASFAVPFAHFAVKTLTSPDPPKTLNRKVRKGDRKGCKEMSIT